MRRFLLAALLLAMPAAAQDEPMNPVISVSYAAPVRAVYRAAFDAMEAHGVAMRARLLDEGILSQPQFSSAQPAPDETGIVMLVEVEANGDSTRVFIQADVVHPDGRPLAGDDQGRLTQILMAQTMISARMDTILAALPAGTGGADPVEDSDTYGYGRRNPVRVGGRAESGAANQRHWLEALRGPAGQAVRYRRLGSCCGFPSEHAPQGAALDAYEVAYDGLERPVLIFIDMYTPPDGPSPAPEGFTLASPAAPS